MARTSEEKKHIARMLYLEGKTAEYIAEILHLTSTTIYDWAQKGKWKDAKSKVMSITMWAMQTAANIQEEIHKVSEEKPINEDRLNKLIDSYNKIAQKMEITHVSRYNVAFVKFISEKYTTQHANEVLDPNQNFVQNITELLDEFTKTHLNKYK